nr:hypothetical protein [Rhodospirillales bacterium]
MNSTFSIIGRNRLYIPVTLTALFALGFVLNSTYLLPHTTQINYWDEVIYVAGGKDLFLHHSLWPYPRGPIIAIIYAVIFPFMPASEYWLIAADMVGRILGYSLLFAGAWLVGRELEHRKLAPALLLVALFTALPIYTILLPNPSYWTFASFVGLTLWLVLRYARTQERSALVGMAIMSTLCLMSRPDLIFAASALLAAVLVTRPLLSRRTVHAALLMIALPAACIAPYIGVYGLQSGSYIFGAESKLYDTFEAANQVLFSSEETAGKLDFEKAAAAKVASEKAFGTAAENKHSVLRAIARNPGRFGQMVWRNTVKRTIPDMMSAFGTRIPAVGYTGLPIPLRHVSPIILFFVIAGIVELARRKQWRLLLVLLIWPADIGLYLLTISFPGYYLYHLLEVMMLATIGLWATVARLRRWWILAMFAAVLAATVWLDWNPDGRVRFLALGGGALICAAAWKRNEMHRFRPLMAGAVVGGLLLINLPDVYHSEWPGKDIGYFGQARYLRQHYPPTTATLSYPGFAVVSANMLWLGARTDYAKIKSKEDFIAKMKQVGTPLILTDPMTKAHDIYHINTTIEKYAAEFYRVVWKSADGQYSVMEPKDLSHSNVKLLTTK